MPKKEDASDDVTILAPDRTLLRKLGGISLDVLFSKQVIAEAQQIIERSADQFVDECTAELNALEKSVVTLNSRGKTGDAIAHISATAFSIKSKAGLSGYNLVSMIAKSLQLFSEKLGGADLTPNDVLIVAWHVDSMKQLFALKIKGDGGQVGESILCELNKLTYMAEDSSADGKSAADGDFSA